MKQLIVCFIYISFFFSFLFIKDAFAVTTSISNLPQSISADPFSFTVTISGAGTGTNYLRIDLYKPSSSNYFAETFNGSNWYGESDYTQYYPINIQAGNNWSGQIQGRVGTPISNQYDGPGTYKLRVRRYTSSGNYNTTEANNSATDVTIDISSTTPTLNPTPTRIPPPTQSQSPTPIPTVQVGEPTAATSNLPARNATQSVASGQPQTYNKVYLSEVMIDPETGNNDWVEIYNDNEFEIDLSGWYIDDLENAGTTPKQLALIIPAKNYKSFEFSGSIFNNSGDSVRLLDFDQKEIDGFQYKSSEKGKSLGRSSFDNDNFCLQAPSKEAPNGICLNPTATPTPRLTNSSTALVYPTNAPSKTSTITLNPSKTRPTASPVKFSPFTQDQPTVFDSPQDIDSDILGIATTNESQIRTRNRALLSSLSFASFAYALLVIISILLKIKKDYQI